MTSLTARCLSVLFLPPVLLLLLVSSTHEQVRAVCSLSGAAALAQRTRRRRQVAAIAIFASLGARAARPTAAGVVGSLLPWE
jgi:hypothetical protein